MYDGDPTAPVQSLHVFTPVHAVGIDDGKNTHSDEFDTPPATSGSTRACIRSSPKDSGAPVVDPSLGT